MNYVSLQMDVTPDWWLWGEGTPEIRGQVIARLLTFKHSLILRLHTIVIKPTRIIVELVPSDKSSDPQSWHELSTDIRTYLGSMHPNC